MILQKIRDETSTKRSYRVCCIESAASVRRSQGLLGTMESWPHNKIISALVQEGIAEIEITWAIDIGTRNPKESVDFLRFLRDCISYGLHVRWQGQIEESLSVRLLSHLTPPHQVMTLSKEPALDLWRTYHRYGLCYWRQGPRFVLVKDTRPEIEAARFILDNPVMYGMFLELMQASTVEQCCKDSVTQEALHTLVEENLVLQLHEWVVALPYRMQYWPILSPVTK